MKTRLITYFITLAFLPWLVVVTAGLLRGSIDIIVLLAAGVALLLAGVAALFLAKLLFLPIDELMQFLRALSESRVDAAQLERVQHRAKEYADVVLALSTTLASRDQAVAALETQCEQQTSKLEQTERAYSTTKAEAERLNNVMVDRELRMIELKSALHTAHTQLGVEVETPTLPDVATGTQFDDPEHERAAMLNLLEDLQSEKKQLATAKAKDDAIFRSIGDGIVVADAGGRITFLNHNARVLLGLGEDGTDAEAWAKLPPLLDPATNQPLPADDIPLYQAVRGEVVQKHTMCIEDAQAPKGRYVEMTATPVMVSGIRLGGVATVRDITKEQEIDRAKTEFVSLASHQLRTPLSAINWYAEMLLAGDAGELNDEQREYLNEVYQGNQRMVDLINSLLNVSRLELGTFAIDPEDTDVIALAESVLGELAPQIKARDITLAKEFDTGVPHLFADPKLVRMVFQNLASNAVKYTPPGGSVTVTIGQTADDICIDVADTGLGIPQADQHKIFSKLFRATNARESDTDGTGLGLYIVKSVVEHAGGTIQFTSTEGHGTTFSVRLPKSGMHKKEGAKSLS